MVVSVLQANLLILLFIGGLLWLISLRLKNASIVDIFWGAGFAIVALVTLTMTRLQDGGVSSRGIALTLMACIWGIRLAGYLAWRNWGKPEDYRYAAMRQKHGDQFWLVSLFTVYGLQSFLLWLISWPLQFGISSQDRWSWLTTLGLVIWFIGLSFEAIGDYQLARFKANPRNQGQVMCSGLWRYTRHPNYFGDFMVWWGIFFAAVNRDNWWLVWIGPAIMSVLLMRVSGVKLLESSLEKRLEGYAKYVANTSSFFPLPPRGRP